jgi:hypothetical protein
MAPFRWCLSSTPHRLSFPAGRIGPEQIAICELVPASITARGQLKRTTSSADRKMATVDSFQNQTLDLGTERGLLRLQ